MVSDFFAAFITKGKKELSSLNVKNKNGLRLYNKTKNRHTPLLYLLPFQHCSSLCCLPIFCLLSALQSAHERCIQSAATCHSMDINAYKPFTSWAVNTMPCSIVDLLYMKWHSIEPCTTEIALANEFVSFLVGLEDRVPLTFSFLAFEVIQL